jgi:hypothetical protein
MFKQQIGLSHEEFYQLEKAIVDHKFAMGQTYHGSSNGSTC